MLLIVEGWSPVTPASIEGLKAKVGIGYSYHLRPVESAPPLGADAGQAVTELRAVLDQMVHRCPGASLHLVTTAPVGLIVELGRMLRPAVWPEVILYLYDAGRRLHVQVLDLATQRILSEGLDSGEPAGY